jgi:hypothetical protein
MDYLNRKIIYQADPARPYIFATATWGPELPAGPGFAGSVAFSRDDPKRPWWRRAPMCFADRTILLDIYVPAGE